VQPECGSRQRPGLIQVGERGKMAHKRASRAWHCLDLPQQSDREVADCRDLPGNDRRARAAQAHGVAVCTASNRLPVQLLK
jgi:hypothetical protein